MQLWLTNTELIGTSSNGVTYWIVSKHQKRVFCKSTPLSYQGQPLMRCPCPAPSPPKNSRSPQCGNCPAHQQSLPTQSSRGATHQMTWEWGDCVYIHAKLWTCHKVIYYQNFSSKYRDSSPAPSLPFTKLNFIQHRLLLTALYDGHIHLFITPTPMVTIQLTCPHNIPIVPFTSLLEDTCIIARSSHHLPACLTSSWCRMPLQTKFPLLMLLT